MAKQTQSKNQETDTDTDRYPEVKEALNRILSDAELPKGPVERIEVTFLASGEATYRVWQARAEEPDGGYLPSV